MYSFPGQTTTETEMSQDCVNGMYHGTMTSPGNHEKQDPTQVTILGKKKTVDESRKTAGYSNGQTTTETEMSQDCVNGMYHGTMTSPGNHEKQDPTQVTILGEKKTVDESRKTAGYSNGTSKYLSTTSLISREGGVVVLGTTGVKLEIPPNAFQNDYEEHKIEIRILPHNTLDEKAKCFEDHSTTMVEILPNGLLLKKPATLTLPHCLILNDEEGCKVQVFHSHHSEEEQPTWQDISNSSNPKMSGAFCKLELKEFSWIKFTVDGQWVEGKKLYIYTLGEIIKPGKGCVTALVGYLPALPEHTGGEATQAEFDQAWLETPKREREPDYFHLGHWQSLIFRKEPSEDLKISVETFMPEEGWEASTTIGDEKRISYKHISTSQLRRCPFTFKRLSTEAEYPTCHFKVEQHREDGNFTVFINLEKGRTDELSATRRVVNVPVDPPMSM